MTQEEKANAYDKLHEKIALRFGSNVAEEIFSEFEMSEDEKIRKAVIEEFQVMAIGGCEDKCFRNGVKIKEALAWLEKQGQSKKTTIWKHWKDGVAGGSEGEQIYLIKNGLHYSISSCLGYECDYIELSELDKMLSEKQNEQMFYGQRKECLDCQFNYAGECKGSCAIKRGEQKPIDWGKQIKYNPNAPSITEENTSWSEEDEVRLQACIDTLQAKSIMGKVDTIHTNWLKSLKQRYTWKPSDEQMKLLKELVEDNNQRHFYALLKSLYVQLKTLKGE